MFLPVQLWYHIAVNRTGFQDKELSSQDEFSRSLHSAHMARQWMKACSIDSSNALGWNCQMRWEQFLANSDDLSEASSLLRHLFSEAQSHKKWLSSFITLSTSIKPFWAALITHNLMLYRTMVSCQSDLPATKRKSPRHVGTCYRRNTHFWACDGSLHQPSAHFSMAGKIV